MLDGKFKATGHQNVSMPMLIQMCIRDRVMRHGLDLADDARVAAARDHASLMERQRTEVAPAEAAAVVDLSLIHI